MQKQKHTISRENTIEYLWVVVKNNMRMKTCMGTLAVKAVKQSKLLDGKIEGTIHVNN